MRECFVIMPIGSGKAHDVYRNRYKGIIEPAVEGLRVGGAQVFRCVRADLVSRSGSITRDVLNRLYQSDVVVADLTGLNPNVFYELGVRHALRSGTILIALKGSKPPFDVGDLRIIPYEDRVGGEKEAIRKIREMLLSLADSDRQIDSPVLHAIPQLSELGAVKEHQARVASLERERELLKAQLEVSERTSLANQKMLGALDEAVRNLGAQLSDVKRHEAELAIESAVQGDIQDEAFAGTRSALPKDVEVDPASVFILMPFSKGLEPVYEAIRDTAIGLGLRPVRADKASVGPIIEQIFEMIARSGLVIADLTWRNPNVMYELGLAIAMGKRTLLLAQRRTDVPFDIAHYRVILYQNASNLRKVLVTALRGYLKESGNK